MILLQGMSALLVVYYCFADFLFRSIASIQFDLTLALSFPLAHAAYVLLLLFRLRLSFRLESVAN